MRALELTAPVANGQARTLPAVVAEMAARMGDAPALLSDRACFSYAQLAGRANQYARWAIARGLAPGQVLCLLMSNQPEYLAAWLGLIQAGVIVALVNTNLRGASLAYSIAAVQPRRILVEAGYLEALEQALPDLSRDPRPNPNLNLNLNLDRVTVPAISCWAILPTSPAQLSADFDLLDLDPFSSDPLSDQERPPTRLEDTALYIYTSGTTGLPKAARVSHARLVQWSHWFAGMMEAVPADRLYNCLPMYHSVGGVQAPGAMLVVGGSVVLRDRFSATAFWPDIERWGCTIFQYIGELCRYLLHTPPVPQEQRHRLRLACGNGLSADLWPSFEQRFQIPQILEFYASTEGNVSLFNVEGRPGSIGRVPAWLAHRFSPALVRVDPETGSPLRGPDGWCLRSEVNEPGEALGRIRAGAASAGSRFDGYTSDEASRRKILCNVFAPDDAWFRTGDLMRRDADGFYSFVDRLGDTFRRKGENVSTLEVAAAIARFPGVTHAIVYGVAVPRVEGKVGMAAIVADPPLDLTLKLDQLQQHLAAALPAYACPVFLRLQRAAEVTGTWKYSKAALVREAYHPGSSPDAFFVAPGVGQRFRPLDPALYQAIERGTLRF